MPAGTARSPDARGDGWDLSTHLISAAASRAAASPAVTSKVRVSGDFMSNASRFTYVNDYAAERGFGAAFPNFHEADYGFGVVHGTIFLNPDAYDFQDVPVATYGVPDRFDVPSMMRAANDYAVQSGYAAGIPTFHIGSSADGAVYGTILIKPGVVAFRDVPRTDLGGVSLTNIGGMFRAANDYAASNGFFAAFPTFHQANYGAGVVYGLQCLLPGTGWWRDVPRSELALFGRAPKRWAIILCTLAESTFRPRTKEFFEQYFTEAGAGTGQALDFWRQVSYGGIDMRGSRVFGWFETSHSLSELEVPSDPDDPDSLPIIPPESSWRRRAFGWGIEAARQNGVPVDDFEYHLVVCPGGGNGGAGARSVAIADIFPEWKPAFVLHEMGHGFGLGHSREAFRETSCDPGNDSTPGAYCDRWDLMSFGNVFGGQDGGTSLNAMNRQRLGCLPDARIWRPLAPRFSEQVVLAALERPEVDAWLAARIESNSPLSTIPATMSSEFLVEYREPDRWDSAVPGPAVLVHGRDPRGRSLLLKSVRGSAELRVGDVLRIPDTLPTTTVRVEEIDPSTHTATVRLSNSWLPAPFPVRITEIVANPPGPDVPGGERLVIRNFGATAAVLSQWSVGDLAGHGLTFYDFVLAPGAQVLVWTKDGVNDAGNVYMRRKAAIWNNTGDTASLKTNAGVEVSRLVYTRA